MANNIAAVAEKFTELDALRNSVLEKLQSLKGTNDAQLDLSTATPAGISAIEIDTRIMALCEMVSRLPTDDDKILIPQSTIDSAYSTGEQLIAQYQSILNQINNLPSHGDVGVIDPGSWSVQSANGQLNIQVGQSFQKIWNQSEAVLTSVFPLLTLIRGRKRADFSAALSSFSKVVEEAHKQRSELANLTKEAQADRKKIGDIQAQSVPLRDEIERLKTESEKDRKSLAEYAGEGTQTITSIRSLSEQASQLETAVEEYKTQFENFQKQLDQREKALQNGTKRQEELITSLDEIEQKIIELNQKAEDMLSGATVAGLAGSFGKLRGELSTELWWARFAFYFAIFLLFLSVIPLVAYVVPGLGEWLSFSAGEAPRPHSASTAEMIGQIIARALLLLPAAWFAKFAASRHAALFRLKEHYAYKYSVAASVEGFKKQAEPFKDAIAATTFFELTFNPADRMDSKSHEARHPNPVMEWIMKKLGATHDGQ